MSGVDRMRSHAEEYLLSTNFAERRELKFARRLSSPDPVDPANPVILFI
jgi:hypothetical protein